MKSSEICWKEPEQKEKDKNKKQSQVRATVRFVREDKVYRHINHLLSVTKTVKKIQKKLSLLARRSLVRRKRAFLSLEAKHRASRASLKRSQTV